MPSKLYKITWQIDDSQPKGVHKAALAQTRALEAAHLRALKAMEATALASSKATTAAMTNGHAAAAASATKHAGGQVQSLKAVEAAARKAAQAVSFVTQAPAGSGLKTVLADLNKLHASLAKDKGFYVAPGGAGSKPGAYANVTAFLEKARRERIAVDQPKVGVSGGEAFVDDGRHRLARLMEMGVKRFPVSVPEASAAEFAARFGAGRGGRGAGMAAAGAADKGPTIDVGYYRVVAEQVNKEIALEKKKAAEIAKIHDKARMDEYNAGVKAARTQEQQAERDAAAAVKRAERQARQEESNALGPHGRLAKIKRQALTEDQMNAAALNRAQDAYHDRRINQISKERYGYQTSFREAIMGATGLDQAATGVGAALLAMSVGRTVLTGITGAFQEAKKNADAMAERTLATVAGLKALASVAGKKPTEEFGAEVLGFGVKTGLGAERAARFQESFLGRAQIVKGKTISEPEFEKFKTLAGKVTAGKGIPEDVAGDLFGGVLKVENFTEKAQGANEAIARAMTAIKILDAGSGKMAVLAPQLNQALAELTSEDKLAGVFRNAGEAAAAISTAAEFNPQEAGTLVSRTSVGLRDFENKDKRAFFKRAAITDRDSFIEAIAKANVVIGQEVAKGIPVDTAIKQLGFTEIRETRGLKTFFGARETVLRPQLATLAAGEGAAGVTEAQAQIQGLTAEKTFRDAQAQALVEKARFEIGRKSTDLDIARNRAKAQLTQFEGFEDTVLGKGGALNQWIAGAFSGFTRPGSNVLVEERALNLLKQQAGEGGPAAELQSRITAQYGDTAAEAKRLAGVIEQNNKLVAENNALMRAQAQGRAQQAPAAMPLIGPANGPRR